MTTTNPTSRISSAGTRTFTTRLLRGSGRDERGFDRRFWSDLGPEARFEAAWDMVLEAMTIKGRDDVEQGLQRSVEALQRPRR